MTYSKAVTWLFEQFPSYQLLGSVAYKPTLENTQKILAYIDDPHLHLKFVHVAGSNGKGSTCSMIASALTEAGHKVGLFTSPHIEDYTERIRVNGVPIPEESVIQFVEQLQNQNLDFAPSFFEMTFALALQHFEASNCDICVIETGLGGRLDATNVITPLLSLITNISLEHTAILGDTLEKIAFEKAGIIKSDVPLITAEENPVISDIFRTRANELSSRFAQIDHTLIIPTDFPLLGSYQHANYRLAFAALNELNDLGIQSTSNDLHEGLKNLHQNSGLKARLQIWKTDPLTILDVSHNPAGIVATLETIRELNRGELHVIYGTSSDKDISAIIQEFPLDSHLYLTEFTNPRSAKLRQLKEVVSHSGYRSVQFFDRAPQALLTAQNTAKQTDTILIIGSFFLVSDFF